MRVVLSLLKPLRSPISARVIRMLWLISSMSLRSSRVIHSGCGDSFDAKPLSLILWEHPTDPKGLPVWEGPSLFLLLGNTCELPKRFNSLLYTFRIKRIVHPFPILFTSDQTRITEKLHVVG